MIFNQPVMGIHGCSEPLSNGSKVILENSETDLIIACFWKHGKTPDGPIFHTITRIHHYAHLFELGL